MSVISLRDRQITLKVVYYGPATGGKTTSLQYIHRMLDPEQVVKLVSLSTAGDQTLFFDFLPLDLGRLNGFGIRVQGFTVPGQIRYARTRKFVLAGADAVVFVANSDPACAGENAESIADFKDNLAKNGLDPESIPLVVQYNKRDLEDAAPVEVLRQETLFRPVPDFETVATRGEGVYEAFREVTRRMVLDVADDAGIDGSEASEAAAARLDALREESLACPRPAEDTRVESPTALRAEPMRPEKRESELLEKAITSGIELSRLYAEVSVARRRLEVSVHHETALNRLARRLLIAPAPEEVRNELFLSCKAEARSERASLLGFPGEGRELEPIALDGLDSDPLLDSMGDRAEPFLRHLGDAAHLSRENAAELVEGMQRVEPDLEWVLLVPVMLRGDVDCAVVLYRAAGEPPFHLQTTRFLSAVAALAALGLGRATREEEIVRLNRELEDRVRDRTSRLSTALLTIRNLNKMLEERVQMRTSELEKANETIRRTEDFLLNAEKMSSLARLASGIAHEINNPMAYVQGNLRTLGTYAGDIERSFRRIEAVLKKEEVEDVILQVRSVMQDMGLRMAREDLASLVQESAEGATRVVRIAEGMRNLAYLRVKDAENLDIHARIEDALTVLQNKLKVGVEVRREFGDLPPVRGYSVLLGQVFLNLIDNSIAAMNGRGTITLRTFEEGDSVVVECEDDGPGIPEENLSRLFEPFFTTKEVGKGTGLGLYTVYQIVERHGGEVSVVSEVGNGTVMRVRLPKEPQCEPVLTAEE